MKSAIKDEKQERCGMKRSVFSALLLVALVVFSQHIVFADEIYQDENGVWTNRPKSGLVSAGEEGAKVLGQGAFEAAEAGFLGLTHLIAAPIQENFKKNFEAQFGTAEEHRRKVEEKEYQRAEAERIAEEKKRVGDISSYERVDVSNAGAVKSEWEFFEDTR